MDQAAVDGNRNPASRRRAVQACKTCRQRKTRCDAGMPKCSLCMELDVECVYFDSQSSRIDPGTRMILDRIQKLEDRLFQTPNLETGAWNAAVSQLGQSPDAQIQSKDHTSPSAGSNRAVKHTPQIDDSSLTLPEAHYATSNHVYYRWPVLRALLGIEGIENDQSFAKSQLLEATDVFILDTVAQEEQPRINSWHIFESNESGSPSRQYDQLRRLTSYYKDLIYEYFINVHVFYPLLRQDLIYQMLQRVVESESDGQFSQINLETSQYCLLLMVLCLGAFVKSGCTLLALIDRPSPGNNHSPQASSPYSRHANDMEHQLWQKAKLLFGSIISKNTIEATQCFVLASIYVGAQGRVMDSYHFIHTAARKCGIIAKRTILQGRGSPQFSDSFCRLFWLSYLSESDFASELTLGPPSGITQFEEMVPYPQSDQNQVDLDVVMDQERVFDSPTSFSPHNASPQPELAAFQISTNSAIRRFLNRINAVMYSPKEAWRQQNYTTYLTWLLRIVSELEDHHEALHGNLPAFLLSTDPSDFWQSYTNGDTSELSYRRFSNHLWNVARLRGRYFAGQYVMHRPFVEAVLLKPQEIEGHLKRTDILEKSRMCLVGCVGFVNVFSNEPAHSTTNVFATGMATFAMVIILMISTACPLLQSINPPDIEEAIAVGQLNLRRFSLSVKQFEWHISELERLDRARRGSDTSGFFEGS